MVESSKKIFRIISIIMVSILVVFLLLYCGGCVFFFSLIFSSFSKPNNSFDYVEDFENDGTFVYYEERDDEKGYSLCGQVNLNLGDNVYIPPYFNGKPVTTFGCCWWNSPWDMSDTEERILPLFYDVKNLYFSYLFAELNYHNGVFEAYYVQNLTNSFVYDVENGPDNIFIPNINTYEGELVSLLRAYRANKCYITQKVFDEVKNNSVKTKECVYKMNLEGFDFQVANTTFRFNYDYKGSPNEDIFFINDFERGGLIEKVPYKPTRDGYEFAGWYKEPMCINKWDFEKDTLTETKYDEDGELIFVETKLYAKWV